jgi:peptide/nickel transport system substrate-binding protein
MKRPRCLARVVGAVAALAIFGTESLSHADADKVLKVGIQADLRILDPYVTTARVTGMYAEQVFDTLFDYDAGGKPRPQMVGGYTISDDKLTYQFTLRPGLKWHDGTAVRAADCVASLRRWMTLDAMGAKLAQFTGVLEAIDEHRFRLVLKQPYGLVLDSLAKRTGTPYMMPERLARTPKGQQIKEPIGSGPFVFKTDEWRPGSKIVFVRNPDYVPRQEPPSGTAGGKVVKIDRMEWDYIPDANTALSAITVGEIDYLDEVPFDFIPGLKKNPDIRLVYTTAGNPGIIRPNSLQPPFDDPRARRALLYLVDQEEFMKAAVGEPDLYLKHCGAFFICGTANATEAGAEPYQHADIAKAKELFAAAGYNGQPIVVLHPTDRPLYRAWTLVLIQNLRDAGINVDPQAMEWSAISSRRERKGPPSQGGWNIYITAGPASGTDPISSVYFAPACDKAIAGWPCDPIILKLTDQWSRESDPARKRALIEAIQRQAYISLPYVPIGQYRQPVAVRKNIGGVIEAGANVFWNVTKN